MNKVEGVDLKQLVEECEIEFEREKPFKKAKEKLFRKGQNKTHIDVEDWRDAQAADILKREAVAARLHKQRKYWTRSY